MGQPKQRYCKRGHDTEVVGRYGRSECRQCKRDYYQANRERLDANDRISRARRAAERRAKRAWGAT